ncbi:MAG TPA: DedA family protein [Thermoanaerobaculia bacterium]|nr:DedA family protein [Thermoanaerobaculia bacterium]
MIELFALPDVVDLFLHLDRHLNEWADQLGPWLYLVLFAIVFCETGLVVTPFLPGDSLLFAVGALAAIDGSPIRLSLVLVLLFVAGVIGDAVNYAIGLRVGPRIFTKTDSRLFNREHLERTQRFYERYGGKTIFLARFVPIIRTFAPFVAGIGRMSYPRFAMWNVTGAATWVTLFLLAGFWFGNLPVVAENFSLVILAIIAISLLPIAIEYMKARSGGGGPDPAAQPPGA